jgi:hypothetical protein
LLPQERAKLRKIAAGETIMMMNTKEFPRLLQSCILDTMRNLLGGSGTEAVLFHLGQIQYPENPGEFHERIQSIFKEGAATLEKLIVKELFSRLNVPPDQKDTFDSRNVSP